MRKMRIFVVAVVCLMATMRVSAQHFGAGLKGEQIIGEQILVPTFQICGQARMSPRYTFETSLSFGHRYVTFWGTAGTKDVWMEGLNFVVDVDFFAIMNISKFHGIVGLGYVYREETGFEDAQRLKGSFNPEFYGISGLSLSAGIGAFLPTGTDIGKIDLRLLCDLVPCMTAGQKTMTPGIEVALIYFLGI